MSLELIVGLVNQKPTFEGLQIGIENNSAETSRGAQIGTYNFAKESKGIQIGVYNWAKELKGAQIGVVNAAEEESKGTQIGLFNGAEKSIIGTQIGTYNWAKELIGAQAGAGNAVDELRGAQIGAVNISLDYLVGVQFGLFCSANKGTYVQIGLLTFRGAGPWYTRVTPLIGYHSDNLAE